jgi:hypothetical protein
MRSRVALATVAVAAALAGCGGGGGGGTGLSAAEFRQQADAICAEFEQKLNALGTPSSLDQLGEFVDKAIGIIEDGNDKLQALEPPTELADDWDRAMEIQDKNLELTHQLQDALNDEDDARIQELLSQLDTSDAESTRLAQNMGLENCGQENT